MENIEDKLSLHANTFLEHRAQLEKRGLRIAKAREIQMAGVPTSKIRAYFKGNYHQLKMTLRDIFGTNPVLGPNNLGGPYQGPVSRGQHYKLGEYSHAGAEVHGHQIHNTIIDIYFPDKKII